MHNKILLILGKNGTDTADIEHNLKSMGYSLHVTVGVDKAIKTALDILPNVILIDTSCNVDEKN